MSDAQWQPIETAPKSSVINGQIKGIYLLGFCPDEGVSSESCIDVIWWEPLTKNHRGQLGCWYGGGALEMRPTHWMLLPEPPVQP